MDLNKCNACGDCTEACPVDLPSEFDRRLGTRKAIFRPYPQAIPNVFGISKAEGRAPCKASCPAGVNAQGYVALVAAGKFKEAYELVRERCPLPSACGRVCQHPCEDDCNRAEVDQAVAVRDLKRFVADFVEADPDRYPPAQPAAAKQEASVAVVGGGPAGLTAAYDLAMLGYGVTVFEAQPQSRRHAALRHPRLPAARRTPLDREIQHILDLGVEAKTGTRVADPASLLESGFKAVFAAPGAWVSRKLGVPGEDAPGVWEGIDFLRRVNGGETPALGSSVLVIGGGDVAMDAARCARRLPGVSSVHLACLESGREMPAHSWEAAEALEEGIVFHNSLGPTKHRDRRRQGDRRVVPSLHQRVRRERALRSSVRRFQDDAPARGRGDRDHRSGHRLGRAGSSHRSRRPDRRRRSHSGDQHPRHLRRRRRGAGPRGHGRRHGPGPQGRGSYRRLSARSQATASYARRGERRRWRHRG